MEEEHDEEDFKYCPPKKEGLFSVMQSLSPILGSNFLLFDSNGLEYVASGISEPIPTGIPSFVVRFLCFFIHSHILMPVLPWSS